MKALLILLAAVAVTSPLGATSGNPRLEYIEKFSPLAMSEMQRTGVPASITLAQALVESDAGRSPLALQANNHFGIKCHSDWSGDKFYKDDDQVQECFRVYASADESYRAHSDFLRGRERYKELFELEPTDYRAWAKGLRAAGYATDAGYATKLINLIEDYQLYRFDTQVEVEVPSPMTLELPKAARTGKWMDARYAEGVTLSLDRPVREQNGLPFLRAVEGDTWESIAAAHHLFPDELLRFNDLERGAVLEPGMTVYLHRKKAQAAPGAGKFLVNREGLTLWEVSQMFGVQLAKLRVYNAMSGKEPLKMGETVILRKL